jgi:WD40 repeat protein
LSGFYDIKSAVVSVWDVESSVEIAVLSLSDAEFRRGSSFTSDGRLLTGSSKGVLAWNVETGEHEVLAEADLDRFVASADGRRLLVTEQGEGGGMQDPAGSPIFFDLDTGDETVLSRHGLHVRSMALDRNGTLAVTGDSQGVIRVGPVNGEEPHLLLGHESEVLHVAIDPLGRWIASAGQDNTIRLWPIPDLSKPPIHTLPREELIAKLKTLTNLRVVRDSESATGWTLTHDPFPGWETVPTW